MTMNGRWVFLIAFALVFYGNGAAFIESFVNYPSWHLIGEAEFTTYHQHIAKPVLTFLVAPALLGTLFTILMLWFRPTSIPSWAVWSAVILQAIVWVSTATIQVPMVNLAPSPVMPTARLLLHGRPMVSRLPISPG
jgi:hypothetical protein